MGERDQRATVTVSRANRLAQLASWHEEGSLSRYAQAGCSQPPSTSSGATADGTGCNDAVKTWKKHAQEPRLEVPSPAIHSPVAVPKKGTMPEGTSVASRRGWSQVCIAPRRDVEREPLTTIPEKHGSDDRCRPAQADPVTADDEAAKNLSLIHI